MIPASAILPSPNADSAIVPIPRDGRPWKAAYPAARSRNETRRATRKDGRASRKRRTGYHARSRIEAKMRCQDIFGERIAAGNPGRQNAEIQICSALVSRFSALGTTETACLAKHTGKSGGQVSGACYRTTPMIHHSGRPIFPAKANEKVKRKRHLVSGQTAPVRLACSYDRFHPQFLDSARRHFRGGYD